MAEKLIPRVIYSEKLRDYLKAKKRPHIVINHIDAGCCGSITEVLINSVTEAQLPDYLPKAGLSIDTEVGKVLIVSPVIECDEEVYLDLRSFLGAKDITAKGIRAFRFS